MRLRPAIVSLAAVLTACGGKPDVDVPAVPTFTVDPGRVSVSGVSAGAYMAGQLHVAHSGLFGGAAFIAGGPYWCAAGSVTKGLGPCMNGGDVGLAESQDYAREQAAGGAIDDLQNLADDRVWAFHGTLDTIVSAELSLAALSFYEDLVSADNRILVADVEAPHGVPTLDVGAACDTVASPFLNACNYDAAGALLSALSGQLEERTTANGELMPIPQPGADDAEMLQDAMLYVPAGCAAGESCGIHVALHGCQQSVEFVGDAFAAGAGYNEWAEANNLLVLYPQVASSKIAPLNPLGCWDWWGYTGEDYATRSGAQISVIKATLDSLAGTTL